MRLVRIPRDRLVEWLNVVDIIEEYSHRLREKLGRVTVLLHGSYARGDFNLWSDIDLIVVSEKFDNVRVLDRYDLLNPIPPRVEVIPLTPAEFMENLRKNVWRQALSRGTVVFVDDYGLTKELKTRNIEFMTRDELVSKIKELFKYSR